METPTGSIEIEVTHPAAGGGFVGRDEGGRVVFVRHSLPGERVRAVITEEHPRWARADAIEILRPSDDRVSPPCSLAGPGRCGGCDYQHAALPAQRGFKAALIEEQLRRVAKITRRVTVHAGDPSGTGLGTRTRVRFGVGDDGTLGLRRHHSHELVATSVCPLATDAINALDLGDESWPPGSDVEASVLVNSTLPTVLITSADDATHGDEWDAIDQVDDRDDGSVDHDDELQPAQAQRTEVGGRSYEVSPGVFWQVHTHAPELLVDAVLRGLDLQPGDQVLDLYSGAGLFTKAIAEVVGPDGLVVGVEASRAATRDAMRNTASHRCVQIVTARVDGPVIEEVGPGCTHVVLDPPRRGTTRQALDAISALRRVTRIVSVSCDPATFARDLRVLLDAGWVLHDLQAFDLFEMTEHVEIVSVLTRDELP